MWQPTPTDEAVEHFGRLPEVAELNLSPEELKDAAMTFLRLHFLLAVYEGAWLPGFDAKPGPSGIRPASEFSVPETRLERDDCEPVDGRWCGTRAGDEDDGRA